MADYEEMAPTPSPSPNSGRGEQKPSPPRLGGTEGGRDGEHAPSPPILGGTEGGRDRQMLEPEAMVWLRENGIPTLDFRFATNGPEAVQGCREIGYPVVIKVVSPDILHKSDCGGVALDIQDDEAALTAFEAIRRAAVSRSKEFRGVVIYPLVRDAQEVLLGLSRDPQFGPVVVFGLGGIYTEVWHDISLRVAPVDRAGAEEMIQEIKSIRLLQGIRGQKPCDLDELADVLVNFSRLPFRYPEIDEVDLNPVFLFPEGLVVGDVRVIRTANCELTGNSQNNPKEQVNQ